MFYLFKYIPNYFDCILMNINLIKCIISSSLVKKYMKMNNEIAKELEKKNLKRFY